MISLFANISSIRWDYEGTDENNLKGYIVDGDQMRSFEVGARNEFAATNQLWGLIGA